MTRLAPTPTSTRRIERSPAPPVDPAALAVAVATAYVEVRAGRRAPEQLTPLLGWRARRRVHALVLRRRRRDLRPFGGVSVSRVATSRVHDDALEVVAVIREGGATTAVAVRVDRRRDRWVVTDVGTPEDRQPLVPPGATQPAAKEHVTRRGTS